MSVMTNFERLDQAARRLGSPPRAFHLDDILAEASRLFPELRSPRSGLAASMDYQTINIRGRTPVQGDFTAPARWNRSPAFIKVDRATYRRLSDSERACFTRAWVNGSELLQAESFTEREWLAFYAASSSEVDR